MQILCKTESISLVIPLNRPPTQLSSVRVRALFYEEVTSPEGHEVGVRQHLKKGESRDAGVAGRDE